MIDFGDHLKVLRKEHGYTQERLAKVLHVSVATIIRWESNYRYPTFESLVELSKLYDVTLDYAAGIDLKRPIVIDHLSERQISLLRTMVLEFQSGGVRGHGERLSQRQQDIISAIMVEFNKE